MNFVVSSEQLKGERRQLEFTVNNLLHLRFLGLKEILNRRRCKLLQKDNWKVPCLDQSDSAATFDFRAELQLFSDSPSSSRVEMNKLGGSFRLVEKFYVLMPRFD